MLLFPETQCTFTQINYRGNFMRILKQLILPAICLLLVGCSGISKSIQRWGGVGTVTENLSSFDGTAEINMGSAYVAPADGGIAQMRIGASWNAKNPSNIVLLVGLASLSEYSLLLEVSFNLDDEIIKLTAIEDLTNLDFDFYSINFVMHKSDRLFLTDVATLEKIISSTSAKIRIDSGRDYHVGDFKKKSYGNALFLDSLPQFLDSVRKHR